MDENLVNPLWAFEMKVNGQTLKIPMTYSDFEAAGWTYVGDDVVEIEPMLSECLQDCEKDGVTLDVAMANPNEYPIHYTESIISRLEYSLYLGDYNSYADVIELPGGIQLHESTYDDMVSVYGISEEIDRETSDDLLFVRYILDDNHKVAFTIRTETNIVEGVDFDCDDAVLFGDADLDFSTSNNEPAETVAETPQVISAVSLNPADLQFELEGEVYQLPCSLDKFMDNGWNVTSVDSFAAVIKIEKNDIDFNLGFDNSVEDISDVKDIKVTGIAELFQDEPYAFSFSGDITVGTVFSEEHLMNIFAGMNIDKNDDDPEYIFYDIKSVDERIRYTFGVSEGRIVAMSVEDCYYVNVE